MNATLKGQLIKLSGMAFDAGFEQACDFILLQVSPERTSELTQEQFIAVHRALFPHEGSAPQKIPAIKLYQTITGKTLLESKNFIEGTFGV